VTNVVSNATRGAGTEARWDDEEFIAVLRAKGARYHHLHPFHVRMNDGSLTPEELQRWVINRYYYQRSIPIKDAAILSNCPEPDVRREWIQRIIDHDGPEPGSVPSWSMIRWIHSRRTAGSGHFERMTASLRGMIAW